MSAVTITLNFSTLAEATAFLAGREATPITATEPAAEAPKASNRKSKSADTPATTPDVPAASEKPAVESSKPEPVVEEKKPDAGPQLSYADDIQKPVMAIVAMNGAEQLKALMADLGVASLKGSDPAIWPAAKEKLDALLAQLKAGGDLA